MAKSAPANTPPQASPEIPATVDPRKQQAEVIARQGITAKAFSCALEVSKTFTFQKDGPVLIQIIDAQFDAAVRVQRHFTGSADVLAGTIGRVLVALDTVFGWDAPRMDEATEAHIFTWMAGVRVRQRLGGATSTATG